MTLIKQEKLVFILVILYIREYLCVFTKLFTGTWVCEDFQFQVSGSRNNQKSTALIYQADYKIYIHPNNNWGKAYIFQHFSIHGFHF